MEIFHRINTSWIELYWKKKLQPKKKYPAKRFLLFLILVLSLLFALSQSLNYIQSYTKSRKNFQIHKENLTIKELPAWLKPFTSEIAPVGLSDFKTIFDPDLALDVAEAYKRNPWVKQVKEVIKKYPANVYATLVLRKPVAFVKLQEGYFLIGDDGVFLPGNYESAGADFLLPVIEGVEEGNPQAGLYARDVSLQRTLGILSFLSQKKILENIPLKTLRIESMPKLSSSILVFVLKDGSRILWGNVSQPAYVSLEQQEKNLLKLIPFLDSKRGKENVEIDLRFGYNIIRKKNKGTRIK